MQQQQQGHVALVTGGASGIGLAYVVALLERGWSVTLLDLKGVDKAVDSLNSKFSDANVKKRLIGITADVTNTKQMEEAFHTTISHFGSFDLLVNNAGIYHLFFQNLEQTIAINLVAAAKNTEWFIKYATGNLRHPSRIPRNVVITASTSGLVPCDAEISPGYVSSKFGVVGLVRSLKFLGPKFDVRVNCICPVTVDTPMIGTVDETTRKFLEEENRGGILAPQECAKALLKILDDNTIYGEPVTVHSSGIKVEPLDPSNQYGYLGVWSYQKSKKVDEYVDSAIERIKGGREGWSYL